MLELDDIQHMPLTRPGAIAGRYMFVTLPEREPARAWLASLIEQVSTAQDVLAGNEAVASWVNVAFTWNGLRALGVDEASLATFPEEFREGMVARAGVLGDTGANHPDNWVGGLASPDLHAIVVLTNRDGAERERWLGEHRALVEAHPGVAVLSTLDVDALPPLDAAREHFGYRDRLSQPSIEGLSDTPSSGLGPPSKPGEFILGYPDEEGLPTALPQPEILSKNGCYFAYRRLQQHVGAFREFLRQNAATAEDQELLAAKLMGRWRSGAPLVLAPHQDDPLLARDPERNNSFDYGRMDPHGYAVPLGAHIRRMNPRDTAANPRRRLIIRRGGTYGPPLPEGAPDDGIDRGLAGIMFCASLVRQFEFIQNVWVNAPNFHNLGNERDPFVGTHDGSYDFTIPKRPIRQKIVGLPAFTTLKGGAYFFLPGIRALRYLATLSGS